MDRVTYLFKQYENVLDWYKQAESKGILLHAINGLLVGAVNGIVFIGGDKLKSADFFQVRVIGTLLALTVAALVASYLFMLKAIWARHHCKEPELSVNERLWFFGHIGAMSLEQYQEQMGQLEDAHIESTLIAQNHILSRNVGAKFDALNWAVTLTIIAVVLFSIFGITFAWAIL